MPRVGSVYGEDRATPAAIRHRADCPVDVRARDEPAFGVSAVSLSGASDLKLIREEPGVYRYESPDGMRARVARASDGWDLSLEGADGLYRSEGLPFRTLWLAKRWLASLQAS